MRFSKITISIITLLLILIFVPGAMAKGPAAPPFIPDIPKTWMPVYPADLYPDFTYNGLAPACSNGPQATSDEFFFFVKGGTVNNLIVYFQGGGACWDPITCLGLQPYSQDVTAADNPIYYGGMFDLNNPENSFKDWSFVFIPYCTGDIHWGANDQEYTLETTLNGQPVTVTRTIQHRGFVNWQVVLKWITENIEKPHKIFVTGSSAGSYGALSGFPWIKEAFPKAQVSLLGDAGMGVSPPEFDQLSNHNWNIQLPPWLFADTGVYPTTAEFWARVSEYYPHSKVAEYTSAFDGTQIAFYDFMFLTLGLTAPDDPAMDWHLKMWEGLDFKSMSPNYRYYVASGTTHTILAGTRFYAEESAEGIRFLDWVDALVMNQGGTGGHGAIPWINTACDTCR